MPLLARLSNLPGTLVPERRKFLLHCAGSEWSQALPAGLWWSLRTSLLQAKLCTKPCQAALVLELLFQSSPDSLYVIISGAQPRNEETEGLFLAVYSSNLILKKKKKKTTNVVAVSLAGIGNEPCLLPLL